MGPRSSAPAGAEADPSLVELNSEVTACRLCPRLIEWCAEVAQVKRAAYREDTYWGGPVPSFGDTSARLLIVGLAPGAHGANRTGRMFTGDRSGDWLYGALHRAGFASQPESVGRDDGLALHGAWITAAVRCAPPGNRPTTEERDTCQPFLERELRIFLQRDPVLVCLGSFAFQAALKTLADLGGVIPRPKPKFGHGAEVRISVEGTERPVPLICSYHPSQQNTFTGRLTEPMFDGVWQAAKDALTEGA